MFGTIVYYVVGPVHPRNLGMIAEAMPRWTFRIAYEPSVRWLKGKNTAEGPFDWVPLENDQVPESLWNGDVRAVVFSTVQPRQGPINLLRSALARGIPTIAIEESNQIALNNGTINNYLLPVDHVLVASEEERRGMLQAGIPERRVEATGWPFYSGQIGKISRNGSRLAKERLGLEPDRPVAALTLTALHDAGESCSVRDRQLTLAAQGLPSEYQLVVRPHPIERTQTLMPFIRRCAPRAVVVDGAVRIDDLLDATDILLNRGASQVCIESLLREIPVVVLDTGVDTPFHETASDIVIKEASELAGAVSKLTGGHDATGIYDAFRSVHMPCSPPEALEATCCRIEEIARERQLDSARAKQWMDLAVYQAWTLDHGSALSMLTSDPLQGDGAPVNELGRLVRYRATREDLDVLRDYVGDGFLSHVLGCLWIDQLHYQAQSPADWVLRWMEGFPPAVNTVWFLSHMRRWASILQRSPHPESALAFSARLKADFEQVGGVHGLARNVELLNAGFRGRMEYAIRELVRKGRAAIRAIGHMLRG